MHSNEAITEAELSKKAQSVQETLIKKGQEFKVIELSASTRTAKDAADTLGCEIAQIVKSLIFRKQESKEPILVLASGANQVNLKMISQYAGEHVEKADANFAKEVTGFPIGGVPPIGHKQSISTFIDGDLLKFKELWAAAGTPNAVFKLNSDCIQELTGGKVVSIK